MVSELVTYLATAAFFVVTFAAVGYLTYIGIRQDAHSPPSGAGAEAVEAAEDTPE